MEMLFFEGILQRRQFIRTLILVIRQFISPWVLVMFLEVMLAYCRLGQTTLPVVARGGKIQIQRRQREQQSVGYCHAYECNPARRL